MSIKVQQVIWQRFPHGGARLTVLLAIAERSNDFGNGWVSRKDLARGARVGLTTVNRVLIWLKRENWIRVDTGKGQGWPNAYAIDLRRLEKVRR